MGVLIVKNVDIKKSLLSKWQHFDNKDFYDPLKQIYNVDGQTNFGLLKEFRKELLTEKNLIFRFDLDFLCFDSAKRFAALVCQSIGTVSFPVSYNNKLWYPLKVKLNCNPIRTHGIGTNPFHIDYLTRTNPPLLIAFLGERTDPYGGGETCLSNINLAVRYLTDNRSTLLQERYYKYFKDSSVRGVGTYLESFQIIPASVNDNIIRFTSKMIFHLINNPTAVLNESGLKFKKDIYKAFMELQSILEENQTTFLIEPKKLYIFNQLEFVHSRLALGLGQKTIPSNQRRRLLQAYIN